MSNNTVALSTEVQCGKCLSKVYSDLQHLITSFEKGSSADVTLRLRLLEHGIDQLRETVKSIPDIQTDEQRQKDKIRSLYKQIKLKDELIESFIEYDLIDGVNRDNTVKNEGVGNKVEKEFELPLARQQKGFVDVVKESVGIFYSVKDMFDFENVGFTHSVEGIQYLTCADCEFGPIGLKDNETNLFLVTPSRLTEKEKK